MRHATAGLRHGKLAAKLASQLSVTATDKTTVANLLVLRLTFYILCHSLLFNTVSVPRLAGFSLIT